MDTSKLPDLNEISHMAGKLFGDVKKSIGEIFEEYKAKHPDDKSVAKTKSKIEPGKTDNETSQVKDKKTTEE